MPKNKQILMICLFLTVATLMAFWQVNYCDFTNYDDPTYVTENSHIQNGISMDGILWAFVTYYAGNWHPLTWISHMLDVQLFGLNPHWHHLTNLLFHIANTLLLFFVLHRMTKARWQSAFVAALFALHPLHVESVAWVAERKDVLSTLFWMLTMGAYCYYVEHTSIRRYLLVLLFFVLGLMAKPMLVTLPFVLLLLDYWPLQRFEPKRAGQEMQTRSDNPMLADKQKGKYRKKKAITLTEESKAEKSADCQFSWAMVRPLLWGKIPLFVLAVLSSILTFIVQQKGGGVNSLEAISLNTRIANAFVSYLAYIGKMIWPDNLAVFYPYPKPWQLWQFAGAALILIAITLLVIRGVKRLQYLTVGWLWYVVTLVPVIGFVQVGAQARADRYTYIPLIGLFIMAAWGIPELLGKWRYKEKVLFMSSTLTFLCLFIVTWTQVGYWQDSIRLFDHALKVTDNNYLAYNNRGNAYKALGNFKQAIEDYDKAIEIYPKYDLAYYNRGLVYWNEGNYKQAIVEYDKAIEFNPKYADAYNNRGFAYETLGNHKQAIADYDRAIEINPKHARAYNNRERAYAAMDIQKQTPNDYNRTLDSNPQSADAYFNRGLAYANEGNYKQAIVEYDRAIEINPKYADAYNNQGYAYASVGNYKQAMVDVDRAIEINPKFAEAYNNRGNVYAVEGNYKQAIENYNRALDINPKFAEAYNNRERAYAAMGIQK